MIGILAGPGSSHAGRLVAAAFARSVSAAQVSEVAEPAGAILVAIDPDDAMGAALLRWRGKTPGKLVVFGRLPAPLADLVGASAALSPAPADAEADAALPGIPSASRAVIRYTPLAARLGMSGLARPFARFDFAREWNNLGYGFVRMDDSPWAFRPGWQLPAAAELAAVSAGGDRCGSFAGLHDDDAGSVLWFARPAGPIDSAPEWRLVEYFLAHHRADALPCQPVLSEISAGHDAAATMRLDCDEDIASAAPLFAAYGDMGVPFSLAVHTALLTDPRHLPLLEEVAASGGSLLSHSATHPADWGGTRETARREAETSAKALAAAAGVPVRYAVSPFHRTPPFALEGLADAGLAGCIGGISSADPEFLLARGGALAGLPRGFAGHSQQCMLHGDCLRAGGDPLATWREAADLAIASRSLFGWLDHPFSARYAYGWPDEATRIAAHRALVAHIRARARAPLFLGEDDAMDFLRARSALAVVPSRNGFAIEAPDTPVSPLPVAVEYRGRTLPAVPGRLAA